MAKILLVQPNFNKNMEKVYDVHLPLPFIYIATFLNSRGHEARIFDRNLHTTDKEFLTELKKFNPDVVYTNVIMGRLIYDCLEFSKQAKENSHAIIVWGGVLPTLRPQIPLSNKLIDFIIRGETEEAMLDISNAFGERKPIEEVKSNIAKLNNINYNPSRQRMDLNLLSNPDYDLVDVKRYTDFAIITSRGCPYRCGFCYIDGYWKSLKLEKWRGMSAENSINMITNLVEKYKRYDLAIYDDNFPTDIKRTKDIMKGISKLGLKIFLFGRANYATDEIMESYRKGGVWTIQMGLESGSQRMLDFMKKDMRVEQMRDAIKKCKKYKIFSEGSFIFGLPTETAIDLKETVKFIKQNTPDYAGIKIYHPYPETSLYEYCVQNKLVEEPKTLEDWADVSVFHWANINVSNVPSEVLMKTKIDIEKYLFVKAYAKKFTRMVISGRIPPLSKVINASRHMISLMKNKPTQ